MGSFLERLFGSAKSREERRRREESERRQRQMEGDRARNAVRDAVPKVKEKQIETLRQKMVDFALTCPRCGKLAHPIVNANQRYRCYNCGHQFEDAYHPVNYNTYVELDSLVAKETGWSYQEQIDHRCVLHEMLPPQDEFRINVIQEACRRIEESVTRCKMQPWKRVISGGQTGVDRAALDVALELGFLCGGWCPKGRRAEDGPISGKYPLQEAPSESYEQRTEWNVRDSDGTLVITKGEPTGGTAFTIEIAGKYGRPVLAIDLARGESPEDMASRICEWLVEHKIQTLNVAGPRASTPPGIYEASRSIMLGVLNSLSPRKPRE